MQDRRLTIDPVTTKPLLDVIAQAESKGNYDAYFGNAANTSIKFTTMSIADVLKWQQDFIDQGNASSAVGRYQFVNTTLSGLVSRLAIDPKATFDAAMQDRLAMALLDRRGAQQYVNKELTVDEFAANLAKEWAGLPQVVGANPNDSYYASDGLNKARVDVEQVRNAIKPITAK